MRTFLDLTIAKTITKMIAKMIAKMIVTTIAKTIIVNFPLIIVNGKVVQGEIAQILYLNSTEELSFQNFMRLSVTCQITELDSGKALEVRVLSHSNIQ